MFFFKKKPETPKPKKDNDVSSADRQAERREFPRIDKNFVLTYFLKENPEQKIEITQLKNISKGGMCFITSLPYDPNTEIGIELKTPFISETTHLEGIILKSHQKAAGILYETRLQFSQLDPKSELLLNKLIEFINKESKEHNA